MCPVAPLDSLSWRVRLRALAVTTGLGGGENRDDNLSICVEERDEICVSTNRKNYSEPLEILHVTGSVSNSSFIVCE